MEISTGAIDAEWMGTGGGDGVGVGLGGLFAMVITVNLCSESKNLVSTVSFFISRFFF